MKKTVKANKIVAVVLAALIALSCLAACGNAQATVVQRTNSQRGTGFHQSY